ncbi:uncharacterized protein LOC144734904 isoform X1 [Lampetra planeri]
MMPHNVAWCWRVFLWALCCCVTPIGGQDARVAECRLPREQHPRGTDGARSSLRFAYDGSRDSCTLVWVAAKATLTTLTTASAPPRDNASLFTSDRACMRSCSRKGSVLYPTGAEVCLLPKDTGSCRAHFRLWFFNVERRRCENFTYGGCRGNGNRFVEQKTCANVCQHLVDPEIQGCARAPARLFARSYGSGDGCDAETRLSFSCGHNRAARQGQCRANPAWRATGRCHGSFYFPPLPKPS